MLLKRDAKPRAGSVVFAPSVTMRGRTSCVSRLGARAGSREYARPVLLEGVWRINCDSNYFVSVSRMLAGRALMLVLAAR